MSHDSTHVTNPEDSVTAQNVSRQPCRPANLTANPTSAPYPTPKPSFLLLEVSQRLKIANMVNTRGVRSSIDGNAPLDPQEDDNGEFHARLAFTSPSLVTPGY